MEDKIQVIQDMIDEQDEFDDLKAQIEDLREINADIQDEIRDKQEIIYD